MTSKDQLAATQQLHTNKHLGSRGVPCCTYMHPAVIIIKHVNMSIQHPAQGGLVAHQAPLWQPASKDGTQLSCWVQLCQGAAVAGTTDCPCSRGAALHWLVAHWLSCRWLSCHSSACRWLHQLPWAAPAHGGHQSAHSQEHTAVAVVTTGTPSATPMLRLLLLLLLGITAISAMNHTAA
jgi:hypothetical protein